MFVVTQPQRTSCTAGLQKSARGLLLVVVGIFLQSMHNGCGINTAEISVNNSPIVQAAYDLVLSLRDSYKHAKSSTAQAIEQHGALYDIGMLMAYERVEVT